MLTLTTFSEIMSNVLWTILGAIVFCLVLGVIVLIHEGGHFFFARRAGVLCHEFSIGMGPKLYGFEKGGTQYCLRLLPIGGACVMGEDEAVGPDDVNAFNNKTVWERIAVVFAGPFFNFILAFFFALIISAKSLKKTSLKAV